MKELVNLNKLKRDLVDALKQRSVRVSANTGRPVYFRAVGTKEIESVVDDVFANIDVEEMQEAKGKDVDIADEYAKDMRKVADELESIRRKLWRTMKDTESVKEDLNNKIFTIQSDIRHCADEVSWSYFGD